MNPKAPSPAWGDPLSCHPLLRVLSPNPPGTTPRAELLTLLGRWVKEAAAESGDIRSQYRGEKIGP